MAVPLRRPPLLPSTKTPYRPPVVRKPPPKPKPKPFANLYPGVSQAQMAAAGQAFMGDVNAYAQRVAGQPQAQAAAAGFRQPQANYSGLIGGDYGVAESEAEMASQMQAARGRFRQGINQNLIDLGVTDVSKLGGLGQYIDADTITKAAQNKYSQTAQIAQQETEKRAQSEASLAARGMLSSGQTAKSAEDILAAGEGARYSALRSFLGAGEQGLTGLAEQETTLAQGVARARAAAAARAAETYGYLGPEDYGMGFNYPTEIGGYAPPASYAAPAARPAARPAPPPPRSYTIKMAQADTRARAIPIPKKKPPPKKPPPKKR